VGDYLVMVFCQVITREVQRPDVKTLHVGTVWYEAEAHGESQDRS